MSTEDLSAHCKQRFKGIENFLRRVAFNLGNTPSQTEVKIISCIPIDVSDLQQKIIDLEKELKEAKINQNNDNCTSVATALCSTKYVTVSNTGVNCQLDSEPNNCETVKATNEIIRQSLKNQSSSLNDGSCFCSSLTSSTRQKSYNIERRPMIICEPQKEEQRNFFRKKKKLPNNKKVKTHFIYYAQTNTSPFNGTDKLNILDDMELNTNTTVPRSYLIDMIHKQYMPKELGTNISDLSGISSPVCKDGPQSRNKLCHCESDIYSCCQGTFHNIDNQRTNQVFNDLPMHFNIADANNAYYDSSLYDLIPVKEKPVNIKNDFEISVKKEHKPEIGIMCHPEQSHTLPRLRPYTVNYHTESSNNNNYIKNIPMLLKRRNDLTEKTNAKQREVVKIDQQIDIVSSKSCCVELGNVYSKRLYNTKPLKILVMPKPKRNKYKSTKAMQITEPMRKNAECLTTSFNNNDCQTLTSNTEVKKVDGKTEATLNQIKSILQSVLTEIKTNNNLNLKTPSECKPKKDAIVQKEASQCNLQASTFLNSFTYSPYNLNPYIGSISQQINSNVNNSQVRYPQATLKCLQNFPLIIQPRHQLCNTCYRSNTYRKNNKQATTTSTNTEDVKEKRSTETEKLIKEIYKTMTSNVNTPIKGTSFSECDSIKSFYDIVEEKPTQKPEIEENKDVMRPVSNILMEEKKKTDVSEQNTLSKTISISRTTKSQDASTDTEKIGNNDTYIDNSQDNISVSTVLEIRTPDDISSESEISDVDKEVTYIPAKANRTQKKEKMSLFNKFKSVFRSKETAKNETTKFETNTEYESGSDEYQTIYSQKIEQPTYKKRATNLPNIKTHSKISNSKQFYRERSPERFRSPYFEQKYRRHWNQNLIFDKRNAQYSSERPVLKNMPLPNPSLKQSVYCHDYEARSMLDSDEEKFERRYHQSEDPYYNKNQREPVGATQFISKRYKRFSLAKETQNGHSLRRAMEEANTRRLNIGLVL